MKRMAVRGGRSDVEKEANNPLLYLDVGTYLLGKLLCIRSAQFLTDCDFNVIKTCLTRLSAHNLS